MKSEREKSWWRWLVAIVLLWLLFAQALGAARAASITFDEGPHLAVGYATLRTGDLRLQPIHIHPPLANLLAALPLLLDPALPAPRAIPGWEIASLSAITDAVIWQYPHPARLALAGRLPIILLALLGGALVFRWAADWGGAKAGLLALGLYSFDPNVVAHGSLVTTDMAVTVFGLLTFFLLHRYRSWPARGRLVGIGIALGLALASKVSSVLLVPLVGLVLLIEGGRLVWRRGLGAWFIVLLFAAGVVWAAYGFEFDPLPAGTHLEIYRALQTHYRLGHPAFLMGQNGAGGWWYYFPVALAIKTPLPTLILLGLALLLFVRRRRPLDPALLLFPPVYLLTSLFSSVDIGYRHLLPLLPFVYVFIAVQLLAFCATAIRTKFWRTFARDTHKVLADLCQGYVIRFASYALVAWLVLGTLRIYPFPLTFFNALAGGPEGGYRWLVDSNLDWGQNLWQLRDWMRAERVERVLYSHFSPARPEVYGVTVDELPPHPRAAPFAPFHPAPGVYAIGATTLQGVYTPDVNTLAWFRTHEPEVVLGHALFIYRVPARPAPDWVAVCFGLPLSADQIRARFNRPDLRLVFYDCAQSQVYPTTTAGRYLLPTGANAPENAVLEFQARQPDGTPAYTLLRVDEAPTPESPAGAVTVEGPLTFLGHRLDRAAASPGGAVILETFWRVDQRANRPLSLMAHLVGSDGTPIAVGDGLGIPVEGWQVGDLILQRHSLRVPEDTPPGEYGVQTGAYWLDTQERWPITLEDGSSVDRLTLDKITILD